jgi:hypothetical protein
MMKYFAVQLLCLGLSLVLVVACASKRPREPEVTVKSLTDRLRIELAPGDPESRIKEVLTKIGVPYSYDETNHCYGGTVPQSARKYPAPEGFVGGFIKGIILISIYVDSDMTVISFKVEEFFTYI